MKKLWMKTHLVVMFPSENFFFAESWWMPLTQGHSCFSASSKN